MTMGAVSYRVAAGDEIVLGGDVQPRERLMRQIWKPTVENGYDDTSASQATVVKIGNTNLRHLHEGRPVVEACRTRRGSCSLALWLQRIDGLFSQSAIPLHEIDARYERKPCNGANLCGGGFGADRVEPSRLVSQPCDLSRDPFDVRAIECLILNGRLRRQPGAYGPSG